MSLPALTFPGLGTVVNVIAVLAGSGLGVLLGHRFPTRTRDTVTDALGLVTLLIGGLSALAVRSTELSDLVGADAPVLIVLGSLLLGGIAGSLVDIEARLEQLGDWLRRRLTRRAAAPTATATTHPPTAPTPDAPTRTDAAHARFVEGFVTSSLVFCVGPLTILGSLSDGLGLGAQQLIVKSVLDGFASIAFAAALGLGVMAAAGAVLVVQGSLTLVGVLVGGVLPAAHLDAITAVGGLLLVGVALRLLQLRPVPVGNLLPALVVAPVLVAVVAAAR
jgi:uncharacterized membrane protein YqgA involved in biofilm formation